MVKPRTVKYYLYKLTKEPTMNKKLLKNLQIDVLEIFVLTKPGFCRGFLLRSYCCGGSTRACDSGL